MPTPRGFAASHTSHAITNVSDVAFTVTWLTEEAVEGSVAWGLSPGALDNVAHDDRGQGVASRTHHVTLSSLRPGSTVYYDILSGGQRDDNGGSHYTAATASTLPAPSSDLVFGQAFLEDGATPATGCIAYVAVQDADGAGSPGRSQVFSALVDENGYWNLNLGTLRAQALDAYFSYSPDGGDTLSLEVACAPGSIARRTLGTDAGRPAVPVAVQPGVVETPAPTPTPREPTATPTPAGVGSAPSPTPAPPEVGKTAPMAFWPWGAVVLGLVTLPAAAFLLGRLSGRRR